MWMFWAWVCGGLFGQMTLSFAVGGFDPSAFTVRVWLAIGTAVAAHAVLFWYVLRRFDEETRRSTIDQRGNAHSN